jgi:multidrug resistance efflux pump
VQSAEADLLARTMEQRRDAAQIEELRKELKRREALLAKRLMDETQVNELRPELAALEQALAAYPPLIASYESARQNAIKQLETLQNWLRVGASGDVSTAISNKTDSSVAIVAAERNMCMQRRQAYTLKANRSGIIARVYVTPGNVVPAGTPVMSIVEANPRKVIGFLPEFRPGNFAVGQVAMLWRQNENQSGVVSQRAAYKTIVESVSPVVEALPTRISPMQVQVQGGQPLRGRRIVFRLPPEHDFTPGETVEIHEIHEGWRDMQRRLVMWLTGHRDPLPHNPDASAPRP